MYKIDITDFPAIYERVRGRLGTDKQADVAAALGMKQSAISDLLKIARGKTYQKGSKNLPFRQLVDWALEAGVSLDWLLTGQEPGASPKPAAPALGSPAPAWLHDLLPRLASLDENGQTVVLTTLEGLLNGLAPQGGKGRGQPPPPAKTAEAGRGEGRQGQEVTPWLAFSASGANGGMGPYGVSPQTDTNFLGPGTGRANNGRNHLRLITKPTLPQPPDRKPGKG